MSKSLISDAAIEKAAHEYAKPNTMTGDEFDHIKYSYYHGQEDMRQLMLQEIVAPFVRDLEKIRDHQSNSMGANLMAHPITRFAREALQQHTLRIGETNDKAR